jgi:hypothetical protein
VPTKTIKLSEFSKELGRFNETQIEKVKNAITKGIFRSIPELVRSSPVDTGQYANSWDYIKDENSITVGNFAPHAPIIEYGTRPYTPPIKPLLEWAKRVLRDSSQPPEYSSDVWQLAKGTQIKISKYGQVPKHIMENNISVILENIEMELKRA